MGAGFIAGTSENFMTETQGQAHGVIFIHSAPAALCPHIEWAIGAVLNGVVSADWIKQPAEPGSLRAEIAWTGQTGSSAAIASALRNCELARFEVTEESFRSAEGQRYSYTPRLGIFHAVTRPNGDITISEQRLQALLASTSDEDLRIGLQDLLGKAWDNELEAFRYAGEDTPVRWLNTAV